MRTVSPNLLFYYKAFSFSYYVGLSHCLVTCVPVRSLYEVGDKICRLSASSTCNSCLQNTYLTLYLPLWFTISNPPKDINALWGSSFAITGRHLGYSDSCGRWRELVRNTHRRSTNFGVYLVQFLLWQCWSRCALITHDLFNWPRELLIE